MSATSAAASTNSNTASVEEQSSPSDQGSSSSSSSPTPESVSEPVKKGIKRSATSSPRTPTKKLSNAAKRLVFFS